MLVNFPENYRLYEHVKKSDNESKGVKLSKTHAGGGNERQDAYLYGHPLGRKKRFRSPADFYAHLFWLATDESGDPDNCSCKICTPEELEEKPQNASKQEVKVENTVKQEAKPEPQPRQPAVVIPRQTSTPEVKANAVVQRTPLLPQAVLQPAPLQATPLPQPVKQDQVIDLTYGAFIFRQGEVVWFNRGNAWGLGVIVRRWRTGTQQNVQSQRFYQIQPLSHPFSYPQLTTVAGDESLRPWVAWSVPGFTHQGLNTNKAKVTFENADWNAIYNGKYGTGGDLEVDGSILAAKAIDPTYTTFDLTNQRQLDSGHLESHWAGMYFGAEKIWVGDAVRLRTGNGMEILVIYDIVDRSRTSAFNQQVLEQSIQIVGDVYTMKEVAHTNPAQVFPPGTDLTNLPTRLTEELRQRNLRTIPKKHIASSWKMIRKANRLDLRDIKGRWYEATLLLPLLNPGVIETEFQRGEIAEAGLRINSRHDCDATALQPANTIPDIRKADRRAAFGKAVPDTFRIIEGSNPPPPSQPQPQTASTAMQQPAQNMADRMPIDPTFRTGSAQAGHHHAGDGAVAVDHVVGATSAGGGGGGGGIEDFMDLDGMAAIETVPDHFGQEFGSHNAHGGQYY